MTSSKRNLENSQVVLFEKTLLNKGNAYNKKSGKFTALIDGIYHFDWTTLARNKKYFITELVREVNGLSILPDRTNDEKDKTTGSTKRVDILQQLLNQETIIRMSLEKSVRDLIEEVVDMTKNLKTLESITENLQKDMKRIKIENQRLKRETLNQLTKNVTHIEESITELLAENDNQIYERVNRSLEILKKDMLFRQEKLSKNVSNFEMIHSTTQGSKQLKSTVAFHAKMTSSKYNLGSNQVVLFEEILLNKGNAYNTKSGKFTAPIDGIYHFDWTTLAGVSKRFITLLVREGSTMGVNYCADITNNQEHGQCSSSAIVQMKANQTVWIQTYSTNGKAVIGDWCYFSGHILF
ncbi:uncharacterized protein LOC133203970 [Saccostrea echinata]|uniref:uncharacterized protein LOC133203970 n=1 Tax=Saccostrea echinata TaxID=191078 RepID=UPI002A7F31D6|nr:uncharacterized protein LOC133203970 [Saccostrea echinata]